MKWKGEWLDGNLSKNESLWTRVSVSCLKNCGLLDLLILHMVQNRNMSREVSIPKATGMVGA